MTDPFCPFFRRMANSASVVSVIPPLTRLKSLHHDRLAWKGGQTRHSIEVVCDINPAPDGQGPHKQVLEFLRFMMLHIGIALAISLPVNAGNTQPNPAAQASLEINNLTRDRQIFDSDAARGHNAASVPFSGTTTAPNGTTIEVRAVSVDDGGATSTGFATVVATEGKWSTTLNVPRSTSWYVAEARLSGYPDTAVQTTNRFASGLVTLFSQQSNGARLFMTGDGDFPTIGNEVGDFQYFKIDDASDPESTISGPLIVSDTTPHYPGIAAMAQAFAANAPGLKVAVLFDVKVGKSQHYTLLDSNTTRHFANVKSLINAALPDGGNVGQFLLNHRTNFPVGQQIARYYSVALYGAELNGTPIAGMDTEGFRNVVVSFGIPDITFNHVWAEAMPGLLTGRTQAVLADDMYGWATPNAERAAELETWRSEFQVFVNAWPNRAKVAIFPGVVRWGDKSDFSDTNHFATWHNTGARYFGSKLAIQWLHAAGILTFTPPVFDVTWTGNWLRLHSPQGPVTTLYRATGGTTNFPANASADPNRPGQREVIGFQYPNFSEPTRVEIRTPNGDGSPGPSSVAGDIYIYPEEGKTFDGLSRMYFHRGGGNGLHGNKKAFIAGVVEHHPIVDVGLSGDLLQYGWHVQPFDADLDQFPDGLETINARNDLSAEPVTDILNGAPSIPTGEAIGVPNQLTIETRLARARAEDFLIYRIKTNMGYGGLRINADHSVQFLLRDHTGTSVWTDPNCLSEAGAFDNVGELRTLRIVKDGEQVDLYIDGVLSNSGTFGTKTADVAALNSNSNLMHLFNTNSGTETAQHAAISFFRVWTGEALAPGDTPVGRPLIEYYSDGAGGFTTAAPG